MIHGRTESYAVDDSRIIADGSDFSRASLEIIFKAYDEMHKKEDGNNFLDKSAYLKEKISGTLIDFDFMKVNIGQPLWDRVINSCAKMAISNPLKRQKSFETLFLIIVSEALEILAGEGESEEILKMSERIDRESNNKNIHDDNLFYNRYKDDARFILRKKREKIELREDVRLSIKNALKDYEKSQDSLKNKFDALDKNIKAIQGGTSFSSALAGFKRLERLTHLRLKSSKQYMRYSAVSIVVALAIIFVTVCSSIFFPDSDNIFLNQISKNDLKLYFVSSTCIFVLLYFFRVLRYEVKYCEDKLSEIEMKSAITAFQKGHVDVVSEAGGNVNASLERYEEYIFKFKDKEVKDVEVTDSMNEIVNMIERILKAKSR